MTAPATQSAPTAALVPTPAPQIQKRGLTDRDGFLAWVFLMPSVVYIIALVAVPFFLAIGYAVSDVNAGDPSYDFVGLRNFSAIFDDATFWTSLWNTLIFTSVSMFFIVVLGKIVANILVADFRGKWIVRFLILLPWTTPVTLGAIAWIWLLDPVYSPIDWVLRQLGLLGQPGDLLGSDSNMYWTAKPGLAMASIIAVHVWRLVPLAAVIVVAGLVAIPKDMDEAARMDGAGFWRRMFEVTIPMTLPVIAISALFGAIFTFTDMAVVEVLTNGGPNDSTHVLTSWAFQRGIDGGDIGQGAAMALFLFPLLLAAAIAILRAVRRMEVR